ncbi:protein RAE1 [Cyclospora cayetanensis]|uniref:Protein RAE1 n=1 Tax=Cyclospora cayetanensis TaxID=88456 RepID=A0A6P6RR81_9EIME|nr:protein RAE1 [Cyclospora cayetanensis]
MAFNFGRSSAQTDQVNYYSKKNSSELPNGPSDSVSQLAWSGDGQALACASWDRTCRVWQITNQPAPFGSTAPIVYKGNPQSLFTETAPVLSCCFGDTTQMLLTGGCDKQVKAYDLISGRSTGQVIGQHDSPVNFVAWNPMFKLVISTSWDGVVKMWDGKQPNPVWQQNVGAKICKAAFHDCFLGICDTFRDCLILNIPRILQQGQSAFAATTPSAAAASSIPIVTRAGSQYQKMQNRSIAFFPDDASQSPGAVIGSVEGRCSIVYIKEEHKSMDFSYRCHRQDVPQQGMQIFSVNAISFNKLKLKTFESAGAPIADLKYDPTSTALAYAGPDQQELAKGHHVYIHAMKEEDLRPRPKTSQRR